MQIVIDVPEHIYEHIKEVYEHSHTVEATYSYIYHGTPLPKGHNENNDYAECDQFVCSECGIELQDWHRVERDEDDGDITYHEYTFRYCPNCGARMTESEVQDADSD